MKEESVFTQPELKEFRSKLRSCGYEMTGEIGNCETWTPTAPLSAHATARLRLIGGHSHVFFVTAHHEVTYVSSDEALREISFSRAMELIGEAPAE